MVEAGANQVTEEKLLEALEIAQREIVKLCDAQLELRAKAGKTEVARPVRHRAARGAVRPRRSGRGSSEHGPPRRRLDRRRDRHQGVRRADDELDARTTSCASSRRACRSAQILEKQRSVAVEAPVREQFEDDAARADRGRAGLEGAQVGEAEPAVRPDRRRASSCRSRPPTARRRRAGRVHPSYVKKARDAIYKSLVRQKIAVDKRRPDGRTSEQIRPIEVEVARHAPHARLRPVHARPDADHDAASRSAPRRRASGSTTCRSRPTAATCTTTTSRRSRSGRRAAWARRSGATSATARSPSGRSSR